MDDPCGQYQFYTEVQAAAHLLGCNAAELLERAWNAYRQTPDFREDFEHAQKAISVGDLDSIASRLQERSAARAKQRAEAVKAL